MERKGNRGLTRKEVLAAEKGTVVKKWGGKVPVLIVFPNSYYIGMSNLATHILYKTLNSIPDVVCERYFLEEEGGGVSLESGRPLSSFECIFFSLSFELDYINIPRILDLAAVTVNTEARGEKEPIIVAGGICVMANPDPLHRFFDLFLMGDIEAIIPGFMERFLLLRGEERGRVVEGLNTFPWTYNPAKLTVSYKGDGAIESFAPRGFQTQVNRFRGHTLGASSLITEKTEFSQMFLVEGTRGCPSRCPFCLLGNTYAFTRDRITPLATDVPHIGIIGGGVSFHPHILEVLEELKGAGKHVHLPSLRIDEIPLPVIDLLKDEIKTLTFGIEAGTEQMRRFIGKPLTDEEIYHKIEGILRIKSFNLKLYFMVGLYGETMEHTHGIVDLVKHILHIMVKSGAKRGALGTITVHASPFVPKPGTPFQWLPMEGMEELKIRMNWLKKAFGKLANTYFTHESIKHSFIQGALARGDRRINDVVVRFASGDSFAKVMRENPVNLNFYTLRTREREEVFPWDFIKGQASKEELYKRLEAALARLA
jgi:radical SAM superfamily enzyme YgiQ (UPF0313 family)